MIKCLTCGFNNSAYARTCEKCHNPLTAPAHDTNMDSSVVNPYNETQLDVRGLTGKNSTLMDINETDDAKLRKTISDQDFDARAELNHKTDNVNKCKCGYPLRPGESVCPNCGYDNRLAAKSEPVPKQEISVADKKVNLAKTSSIDTIDFAQSNKPKFKLTVFKGKKSTVFEGLSVVLNRTNTDLDNPNISKDEHALIEFKDNKWVLKDVSSNGATFVQVTQPTEVKDKDLIIIGNVIYRFEVLKDDN